MKFLYLQQPWPQLAVEYDVKAKDLEAYTVGGHWLPGATHAVGMQHVRLRDNQCLDDDICDALPQSPDVIVMVTQVLIEVA